MIPYLSHLDLNNENNRPLAKVNLGRVQGCKWPRSG
jgi:hypothetical protein